MPSRITNSFTVAYRYPVVFTHGAFAPDNPALADAVREVCGGGVTPCLALLDAGLERARSFIDPCYLHQSCLLGADGTQRRFPDLPEAIDAAAALADPGELRTHFHIPLCVASGPGFRSTRDDLDDRIWRQVATGHAPHLEVETYTFAVLPPELRSMPVAENIAAELTWVRQALAGG
jgi:hypothetical protein